MKPKLAFFNHSHETMAKLLDATQTKLIKGEIKALAIAIIEKADEGDTASFCWAHLHEIQSWQFYGAIQLLANDVLEDARDVLEDVDD